MCDRDCHANDEEFTSPASNDGKGPYHGSFDSLQRREVIESMSLAAVAASVGTLAGCTSSSGSNESGNVNLAGRGTDDFGEVVQITFDLPQFAGYPDVGREIANHWKEQLGIQTELVTTSWGTYLNMVWIDQEFDQWAMTPFGGSPERFHPQFYLSVPTGTQPMNVSSFEDPEYTEMFEELTQTLGIEEQRPLIKEMQTYWHENIVSPVSYMWPENVQPYNAREWNITPTELIGATSTSTMTITKAEPKGDRTKLLVGGQEVNQRPNVTAPTANAMDWLFRSVYDTCRRLSFEGEFVNWAAESVDKIDPTTFDITLREGMKFHDGEPVTAEDLKFSFEFLSEYTFGKIDAHVEPIDSVSTETDLTARVNLERRWATFPTNTLVYAWILPEHIWGEVPEVTDEPVNWDQTVGDNPPGEWAASGPLKIREVAPERIELEAYDDHFSGFPKYDEFIYQTLGSEEAIRRELVEDNIDLALQTPSDAIAEKALEQGDHLEAVRETGLTTQCYSFNTQAKPGDDLTFRKATRKVVPTELIIDVHARGNGIQSDSTYIHPKQEFGRDDLPTMKEMYDPEAARQMLEDAGYGWDGQGRLHYPNE